MRGGSRRMGTLEGGGNTVTKEVEKSKRHPVGVDSTQGTQADSMHRPFHERETASAESGRLDGAASVRFLKIQACMGAADFRRPREGRRGKRQPR